MPKAFSVAAPVGAGDIRGGGKGVKKIEDVKKDEGKTSSADAKAKGNGNGEWGQGARKRQAKFVEEQEKKSLEEDKEEEEMDPVLLKGWDY